MPTIRRKLRSSAEPVFARNEPLPRRSRLRGGGPRDHVRPGAARALNARSALRVPAGVALPRGERGPCGPYPLRGVASSISRLLTRIYEAVVRWSLRWKWSVIGAAAALTIVTAPVFTHLGSEFMPPLREGRCSTCRRRCPHLARRGAEAAAGERPHDQAVPRGRSRARQGGARRNEYRSRAALNARDGDHT